MWQHDPGGSFGAMYVLPALAPGGGAGAGEVTCMAAAPGGWLLACTASGSLAAWNYLRHGALG